VPTRERSHAWHALGRKLRIAWNGDFTCRVLISLRTRSIHLRSCAIHRACGQAKCSRDSRACRMLCTLVTYSLNRANEDRSPCHSTNLLHKHPATLAQLFCNISRALPPISRLVPAYPIYLSIWHKPPWLLWRRWSELIVKAEVADEILPIQGLWSHARKTTYRYRHKVKLPVGLSTIEVQWLLAITTAWKLTSVGTWGGEGDRGSFF
jgi:hypothetical protein